MAFTGLIGDYEIMVPPLYRDASLAATDGEYHAVFAVGFYFAWYDLNKSLVLKGRRRGIIEKPTLIILEPSL